MKLKCLHGFFIFEETSVGQISDFISLTDFSIDKKDRYFTFEALKDAPNYSIAGAKLINLPAVATFAGEPWEVFEANEFVYNFATGLVVPISSITQIVEINEAGNYLISDGLILPGSRTKSGDQISGYTAWFSRINLKWTYSEVTYV